MCGRCALPPLPRRLEISYENVANLASEPPVNFINFMKSNNPLLMRVVLVGQRSDMVYLPHRGNFVDHDFLEASCLASFLQHVSPLAMETLPSNSPLHMLPSQRHKFNIKRTEVRIHVNICTCSIKSYFI